MSLYLFITFVLLCSGASVDGKLEHGEGDDFALDKVAIICNKNSTNTNELIFLPPTLLSPSRGEGLPCGVNSTTPQGKGGGDVTLFIAFVLIPNHFLLQAPPGADGQEERGEERSAALREARIQSCQPL